MNIRRGKGCEASALVLHTLWTRHVISGSLQVLRRIQVHDEAKLGIKEEQILLGHFPHLRLVE